MNLDYFKNKLEEEKGRLEKELSEVAKRNPESPSDWEPVPAEAGTDTRTPDPNELSDAFEEFQNRSSIEVHLEERLNEVDAALERIKKGNYGVCTACGEKIDEKRLEANPSAATCVRHLRI